MDVFTQRLNQIIIEKSVNQTKLAKELGIPRTTLGGWCRGVNKPSFEKLFELCKLLNESSDYLMGLKDE